MIDELGTIAVDLKLKFDSRDEYISRRKKNTQERTKILNTIWEFMSLVNKASKIVYKPIMQNNSNAFCILPKQKTKRTTSLSL